MELEILRTVEQAVLRLFEAIDAADALSVAAGFTAQGVWERREGRRIGRDAIIDEMHNRPRGRRIVHLLSNFVLASSGGGRAEVSFKTLAFADNQPVEGSASPLTLPIALDAYRAELIEQDGAWLLSHLAAGRVFARQS